MAYDRSIAKTGSLISRKRATHHCHLRRPIKFSPSSYILGVQVRGVDSSLANGAKLRVLTSDSLQVAKKWDHLPGPQAYWIPAIVRVQEARTPDINEHPFKLM
jgi:hypothetical protein